MQAVGELAGGLKRGGHEDEAVGVLGEALLAGLGQRHGLAAVVIGDGHFYAEVAPDALALLDAELHLIPISLLLVFGNEEIKEIILVVGQSRGIHIGLIVHLLERLLHLHHRLLAHVGAVVEHAIHSAHAHTGAQGYILYPDSIRHTK